MLQISQVTKTFGDFKALDNLTMTVPRGCVYGLVGPNGAGKSTAIRCLLGVYRPDSGSITLNGEPIYENPAAKTTICCQSSSVGHPESGKSRAGRTRSRHESGAVETLAVMGNTGGDLGVFFPERVIF